MYRINEIFYSLQGEGYWTGTPMVFIRFSGCNLHCPFCDTEHGSFREMSAEDILAAVRQSGGDCPRVCITGGEPLLQVDAALVDALHAASLRIHLETNGTLPAPEGIDWITCSPKAGVTGLKGTGSVTLPRADELKLVLAPGIDPALWQDYPAQWHFLQPCTDPASGAANIGPTVDYILAHPLWRLSLQTHKVLNIR